MIATRLGIVVSHFPPKKIKNSTQSTQWVWAEREREWRGRVDRSSCCSGRPSCRYPLELEAGDQSWQISTIERYHEFINLSLPFSTTSINVHSYNSKSQSCHKFILLYLVRGCVFHYVYAVDLIWFTLCDFNETMHQCD